jgi:hypothetical protein
MITDLLTRDRLAERQGGVWDYLSPSRLNLWLKCPLAFRLRYVDGIKTPTSRSLFIGKIVHSALECFYRHRQLGLLLTPADVSRRLIESWGEAAAAEAVSFESTEDEAESCNRAVGLVWTYLAQIPADEPKSSLTNPAARWLSGSPRRWLASACLPATFPAVESPTTNAASRALMGRFCKQLRTIANTCKGAVMR